MKREGDWHVNFLPIIIIVKERFTMNKICLEFSVELIFSPKLLKVIDSILGNWSTNLDSIAPKVVGDGNLDSN